MRIGTFNRAVASGLAALLFFQAATADAANAIWNDRRRTPPVQTAALSLPTLPPPSAIAPSTGHLSLRTPGATALEELARTLPLNAGRVSIASPSKPVATVVLIEDIHRNEEAQRNIGAAVEALRAMPRPPLVALEGASTGIDLEPYRAFPDEDATRAAADYFLASGKISGPVHAVLTSKRSAETFVGAESQALYDENVSAVRQTEALRPVTAARLATRRTEIDAEKGALLSPPLAALDALAAGYRRGTTPLGAYLRGIRIAGETPPPSISNFLAALDIEGALSFPDVERERRRLIETLVSRLSAKDLEALAAAGVAYRLGRMGHVDFYRYLEKTASATGVPLDRYPAMSRYVRYVLMIDAVNVDRLLADANALEARAYDRLSPTAEQRRLIEESRVNDLAEKLVAFSLTREEWLTLKRSERNPSLAPFEAFYIAAEKRDEAMAENLAAAMKKAGRNSGALVIGGFHSAGLRKRLLDSGVACVTFTPRISRIEDGPGNKYLSEFSREKTGVERLFEGRKLFLAQPPIAAELSTLLPGAQIAAHINASPSDEEAMRTWYDRTGAGRTAVAEINRGPGNVTVTTSEKKGRTTSRLRASYSFGRDGRLGKVDVKLLTALAILPVLAALAGQAIFAATPWIWVPALGAIGGIGIAAYFLLRQTPKDEDPLYPAEAFMDGVGLRKWVRLPPSDLATLKPVETRHGTAYLRRVRLSDLPEEAGTIFGQQFAGRTREELGTVEEIEFIYDDQGRMVTISPIATPRMRKVMNVHETLRRMSAGVDPLGDSFVGLEAARARYRFVGGDDADWENFLERVRAETDRSGRLLTAPQGTINPTAFLRQLYLLPAVENTIRVEDSFRLRPLFFFDGYFIPPQPGTASIEEMKRAWTEHEKSAERLAQMVDTILASEPLSAFIRSPMPSFEDHRELSLLPTEREPADAFAFIHIKMIDGRQRVFVNLMDATVFDKTLSNRRESRPTAEDVSSPAGPGEYKFIIPVLPTVYNPGSMGINIADMGYHQEALQLGQTYTRLTGRPMTTDRRLMAVNGSGTGMDTIMGYLGWMLGNGLDPFDENAPKPDIAVWDINPFARQNTMLVTRMFGIPARIQKPFASMRPAWFLQSRPSLNPFTAVDARTAQGNFERYHDNVTIASYLEDVRFYRRLFHGGYTFGLIWDAEYWMGEGDWDEAARTGRHWLPRDESREQVPMNQRTLETGGETLALWENREEVAALPRVMKAEILDEMVMLTDEAVYTTWALQSLEKPEPPLVGRSVLTTPLFALVAAFFLLFSNGSLAQDRPSTDAPAEKKQENDFTYIKRVDDFIARKMFDEAEREAPNIKLPYQREQALERIFFARSKAETWERKTILERIDRYTDGSQSQKSSMLARSRLFPEALEAARKAEGLGAQSRAYAIIAREQNKAGDRKGARETTKLAVDTGEYFDRVVRYAETGFPREGLDELVDRRRKGADRIRPLDAHEIIKGYAEYDANMDLSWARELPPSFARAAVFIAAAEWIRAAPVRSEALLREAQSDLVHIEDPVERAFTAAAIMDGYSDLKLFAQSRAVFDDVLPGVMSIKDSDTGRSALTRLGAAVSRAGDDNAGRRLRNELYPERTRDAAAGADDDVTMRGFYERNRLVLNIFVLGFTVIMVGLLYLSVREWVVRRVARYWARLSAGHASHFPAWLLLRFSEQDWQNLIEKNPNAIRILRLFAEKNREAADVAIRLLPRRSTEESISFLVEYLLKPAGGISYRPSASDALKAIGAPAAPALLAALQRPISKAAAAGEASRTLLAILRFSPNAGVDRFIAADVILGHQRRMYTGDYEQLLKLIVQWVTADPSMANEANFRSVLKWVRNSDFREVSELKPIVNVMIRQNPGLARNPDLVGEVIDLLEASQTDSARPIVYAPAFADFLSGAAGLFADEINKPESEQSPGKLLVWAGLGNSLSQAYSLFTLDIPRSRLFGAKGTFARIKKVVPGAHIVPVAVAAMRYITTRRRTSEDLDAVDAVVRRALDEAPIVLYYVNRPRLSAHMLVPLLEGISKRNLLIAAVRALTSGEHEALHQPAEFAAAARAVVRITATFGPDAGNYLEGALDVFTRDLTYHDPEDMGAAYWERLYDELAEYRQNVGPFNLRLFEYYRERRAAGDAASASAEMRADLDRNLKGLAWGSFAKLDQAFSAKYGFDAREEMRLVSRYVPFLNGFEEFAVQFPEILAASEARRATDGATVDAVFRENTLVAQFPKQVTRIREGLHRDDGWMQTLSSIWPSEADVSDPLPAFVENALTTGTWPEPQDILRVILQNLFSNASNRELMSRLRSQLSNPDLPEEDYLALVADIQRLVLDGWETAARPIVQKLLSDTAKRLASENRLRLPMATPNFRTSPQNRKALVRVANAAARGELKPEDIAPSLRNAISFGALERQDLNTGAIPAWTDFIMSKAQEADLEQGPASDALRQAVVNSLTALAAENPPEAQVADNKALAVATERLTLFFSSPPDGGDALVNRLVKETEKFETVTDSDRPVSIVLGMFDDALHLAAAFATGVCIRFDRARAIREDDYAMEISIQEPGVADGGRILGSGIVQLLRTQKLLTPEGQPYPGHENSRTQNGWTVLAVPSINMLNNLEGHGLSREVGTRAMLEYAQRVAKKAGIPAVTAVNMAIRHQNSKGADANATKELIDRGWLKKAKLSETVRLSLGSNPYSYDEVYVIDIPEGEMITGGMDFQKMDDLLKGSDEMPAVRVPAPHSIVYLALVALGFSPSSPWIRLIGLAGAAAEGAILMYAVGPTFAAFAVWLALHLALEAGILARQSRGVAAGLALNAVLHSAVFALYALVFFFAPDSTTLKLVMILSHILIDHVQMAFIARAPDSREDRAARALVDFALSYATTPRDGAALDDLLGPVVRYHAAAEREGGARVTGDGSDLRDLDEAKLTAAIAREMRRRGGALTEASALRATRLFWMAAGRGAPVQLPDGDLLFPDVASLEAALPRLPREGRGVLRVLTDEAGAQRAAGLTIPQGRRIEPMIRADGFRSDGRLNLSAVDGALGALSVADRANLVFVLEGADVETLMAAMKDLPEGSALRELRYLALEQLLNAALPLQARDFLTMGIMAAALAATQA